MFFQQLYVECLLGASSFPMCCVYSKKIKHSLLPRESQPSRGGKYEKKQMVQCEKRSRTEVPQSIGQGWRESQKRSFGGSDSWARF